MLQFNEFGLLPEGIHKIGLKEFERLFAFNPKRREMLEKGLYPFLEELASCRVPEIYLDGSFVTQEENPDDIDGCAVTTIGAKLLNFICENSERWQEEYRVDFYPALIEEEGEMSKEWWEAKFSSAPGLNMKKGFVALNLISKGGDSHVSN